MNTTFLFLFLNEVWELAPTGFTIYSTYWICLKLSFHYSFSSSSKLRVQFPFSNVIDVLNSMITNKFFFSTIDYVEVSVPLKVLKSKSGILVWDMMEGIFDSNSPSNSLIESINLMHLHSSILEWLRFLGQPNTPIKIYIWTHTRYSSIESWNSTWQYYHYPNKYR